MIGWQGALVQQPYKAVLEQVRNIPGGVYVSCTLYGSPASTAVRPGVWITEVQGRPVHDLDSFLQAVHDHAAELVRRRRPSYVPPPKKILVKEVKEEDGKAEEKSQDGAKERKEWEEEGEGEGEGEEEEDGDEGYMRIKTVSRTDVTKVVAMKLDTHYWETWQLVRDDKAVSGWICIDA